MNSKVLWLLVLTLLGSCGKKTTPESSEESKPVVMSRILDDAPQEVYAIITFRSIESVQAFESKLQKGLSDEGFLSSFLTSIPGFKNEGALNESRPIHIVLSFTSKGPLFEAMLPLSNRHFFEESLSAKKEEGREGNAFFIFDENTKLFGNYTGDQVFLSERANSFESKKEFLQELSSEVTPSAPLRLILAEEKLKKNLPGLDTFLSALKPSKGEVFNTLRDELKDTFAPFAAAVKVGEYSIDIQSKRLTIDLKASWVDDHRLKKEFATQTCQLKGLSAMAPVTSYVVFSHCIASMVSRKGGFEAKLRKTIEGGDANQETLKKLKAINARRERNFRGQVSALYGQGALPFSIMNMTLAKDGHQESENLQEVANSLIHAFNQTQKVGQKIKDLKTLVQLASQLSEPTLGIKINMDQSMPVVGVQIGLSKQNKSRLPRTIAPKIIELLEGGIDLAWGFSKRSYGFALGPQALQKLGPGLEKTKSAKTESKLVPGAPSMRFALWVDPVEALNQMSPLLMGMGPDNPRALELLKGLSQRPTDTGVQISYGGSSQTLRGHLVMPIATIQVFKDLQALQSKFDSP